MGKKLDGKQDKKVSEKDEKNKSVSSNAIAVENEASDDDLLSAMSALDSEDNPYFSDMSLYSDSELSKREMTIGTKTHQSGGYDLEDGSGNRYDIPQSRLFGNCETAVLNGTVSSVDANTNHYEGILGTFDYDTRDWAICKKTVTDGQTGQESEIPVLRYIGKKTAGNDIHIPEGVKILDYTFEGNTSITTVPKIPDSVESAHAAFMGCKSITRASKDSKEGEHSVISDITGTATKYAAGGAVIGTAAGLGFASLPGVTIGAAGGFTVGVVSGVASAVVGAVSGGVTNAENDGKGGTWEMPPNLKDASYMFAGCEKLTEAYKSASDSLLLARGMYKDNSNIGQDAYATKHGSVAVTDFRDGLLSKEAVQESYTGTNVAIAEDLKGNFSTSWNDTLGQVEGSDVSIEDKVVMENLNSKLKAQDVKDGVVETEMAASTDGLAYYSKKRTKSGTTTTMDVTDKNEGIQDMASGGMGNLVDRGIISLAEFSVLKLVTGNALLSAGIVFGGQTLGILPKSMKPVLSMVAGFVGKDSMVGGMLNKIVDKLPDSEDSGLFGAETVQAASNDNGSDMSYSASRIKGSMSDYLNVSAGDHTCDITAMMGSNGRTVANDGTLLSIGEKGPGSNDLKEMTSISVIAGGALEERAIKLAGEDGQLSDEDKKALTDNVMNMMSGLESYNKGAARLIDTKYGVGSEKGDTAHAGLGYAMDTVMEPLKATVTELNAKYDFLSEDDLSKLDNMQVSDGKFYVNVDGAVPEINQDKMQEEPVAQDITIDGVPLDLNGDSVSANNNGDSDVKGQDVDKTEVKKVSDKKDSKKSDDKKSKKSKKSRGEMADAYMGNIETKSVSSDLSL